MVSGFKNGIVKEVKLKKMKKNKLITAQEARKNVIKIIPKDLIQQINKQIKEESEKGKFSTSISLSWYYDEITKANPDILLLEPIDMARGLFELFTSLGFNCIVRGKCCEFFEIYWNDDRKYDFTTKKD